MFVAGGYYDPACNVGDLRSKSKCSRHVDMLDMVPTCAVSSVYKSAFLSMVQAPMRDQYTRSWRNYRCYTSV